MAAAAASTTTSAPTPSSSSSGGGGLNAVAAAQALSKGGMASSSGSSSGSNPSALDAAIFEIKEAIKATAARPGFNQMRSFLFNNNKDEEVVVVHDGANQEEYQRLKNSVVKIKMMVYRTSLQFKLPYSEVLKRAAEKHKEDKPAVAVKTAAVTAGLPQQQPQPQQPEQAAQQQQQPPTLTVQLPQQPVAVSTPSANHSSPSLPVILAHSTPTNNGDAATSGRPTPVVLSPQVSRPLSTSASAPAVVLTSPGGPTAIPIGASVGGPTSVPIVLSPASASTSGLSVVLTSSSSASAIPLSSPQPLLVSANNGSRPPASVLQMSAQAVSAPSTPSTIPPPPSIASLIKSASTSTASQSPNASSLPTIVLPTMPDASVTREVQASRAQQVQLRHPQQPQGLRLPQQLSPASVGAPPSPALPTTPLPPPAPLTPGQSAPPPQHVPTPEEQRILRYGKAILKLKHFRRNLKYAIWDYQDGKSIAESCQKNKITEQGLRYTLDLITSRTGETLEQFRDNKSSNCDELPGPRTDEYTANLRQAVFAFKQKRFGSLFEYASQNQVSLFDLVDELIKELEIENKLCRLKPVAPAQLGQTPTGNSTSTASTSTPSSVGHPAPVASVTSPPPSKQPRQHHQHPPMPRLQSPPPPQQHFIPSSPATPATPATPVIMLPTSPVALSPQQQQQVSPAASIVRRASSTALGSVQLTSPVGVTAIPNVIVARNDATEDDEITALANESPAAAAAASSSNPFSGLFASDSEEACSILSDIDELIRDEASSVNTSVSGDSVNIGTPGIIGSVNNGNSTAATVAGSSNGSSSSASSSVGSSAGGGGHGGVITLSICGVCQRYFTDAQAFKEHEAAGCIDFEVS